MNDLVMTIGPMVEDMESKQRSLVIDVSLARMRELGELPMGTTTSAKQQSHEQSRVIFN